MKTMLKVCITLSALAIAVLLGLLVWRDYLIYPWTRDAQVQSYVVGIAARVSGPMVRVAVKDNQWVNRGDLLFEIDPTDYAQKLAAAKAALNKARVSAQNLSREVERRRGLVADELISLEEFQTIQTRYEEALADIAVDEAQLELARLQLSYTKVYATVDGYVTNLVVTEGTYVTQGQPLVALVDADAFWVSAYFKETDLKNIRPGNRCRVSFMGHHFEPMEGVVESTGWGIFRYDGAEGQNLLPTVKPTVDWVRLAQRFPVRVHLIDPPEDLPLRIGLTASVMVFPEESHVEPPAANSQYPMTVKDGRGNNVIIPAMPQRIVSLAPSTTEIVNALGKGDLLVATTEHCTVPDAQGNLPRLSTYPTVPFESIIALGPDLVLLADITDSGSAERLRRFGLPVLVLNSDGYEGVMDDVHLAGSVLSSPHEASEITRALGESRRRAQAGNDWERPRTVLFLDRKGEYAAGAESFADGLIEIAGGDNIAVDALGKWPQLSREFLVEADPEVILISEAGGNGQKLSADELAAYREDPLWGSFSAVQNGRVYAINSDMLNVPGPRVRHALEQIANAIQDN